MKTALWFLCLLCVTSLVMANDTARITAEDDVREAVFRHLFQHNASGLQKNAKAYFLNVEKGADPADVFLNRFTGHAPPVKKASQSRRGARSSQVEDKETGAPGLVFSITRITWLSDTEAEVHGGYYEANLSASFGSYRVKKINGKWIVTETGPQMIA